MRVAVTGATGFVGRHVLSVLRRRNGVEVIAASRSGLATAVSAPQVQHVAVDVDEPASAVFDRLGQPEVLVHLAWGGLPNYRSLHHFESQLPMQYRFLQGLLAAGLKKLVCTGTCFEYGMQSGSLHESSPIAPDNPYGYAKAALHRQLEFLQATREFGLTWARLFYMYGADQPANTLYSQVQAALQRSDSSFPMSPGDQLRDYMRIDDVAATLVTLALDAPAAGTVNVCSGIPVSVRSLVEQWIEASGKSMALKLGAFAYPTHEPRAFWGSNEKLASLLGCLPDVSHDTAVAPGQPLPHGASDNSPAAPVAAR